ncbi:hypothetical protein [Sphingomonas sp.]|uniref:hypothetical protein n=1 Tax=Sphingomonas sp. TaxID=28214 RepID=UPI003AFFCA24
MIALPIGGTGAGCAAGSNAVVVDTFAAIASTITYGAPFIVTRGWSLVGIGAARYRRTASPAPSDVQWASRGAARSRDGHHYRLEPSAAIEVDQFGAIGDDEANDYVAIQSAIAFWQTAGGTVAFSAGRRYFVGAWSGRINRIFMIDHLRDAVIDGRGATIRSHSATPHCQTFLFTLRDFSNVTIRSMRATDSGTDINAEWRGLYFISPDANLGDCDNLTLDRIVVYDAVAFLFAAGTLPQRVRGIRVTRSSAVRCYYGMVFAENGDKVRADLSTRNCRRSYFAYGVSDHEINLTVDHDSDALGADACFLIKRYVFDTRDIRLNATFRGSVARFSNLVKLEHQPDPSTGTARISDIRIVFDLLQVSAGLDRVTGIGFSSYSGMRLETVRTANTWSAITISGDLNLVQHPITAYSGPSIAVRVNLEGPAARIAPALPSGFTLIRRSQTAR